MPDPNSPASASSKRPLSPHLQIYTPLINTVMSILHRITGAALYVGSLLLAWWLVSVAAGPVDFGYASAFFGSSFGHLVLFGYTWALIHHMIGGVRHFIWDTGTWLDIETVDLLSWATIILSAAITGLIWLLVLVF